MNLVVLSGRLKKDPQELPSRDGSSVAVVKYTLIVERKEREELQPDKDFITCTAFGNNAAFAMKYLKEQMYIVVQARIQTGNYTNKEGQKVYTTDIVIENQEFAETKARTSDFRPAPFMDTLDKEKPLEPPEQKKRGRR